MSGGIPARVRASAAIARRQAYAGSVPVSQLPRLKALLAKPEGELDVSLTVTADSGGGERLEGVVRGILWIECQRGLHPYAQPLELSFSLRLVHSDAEELRWLKQGETLRVDDDSLPLREVVEDEVLLALPLAPRCEQADCLSQAPEPPEDMLH